MQLIITLVKKRYLFLEVFILIDFHIKSTTEITPYSAIMFMCGHIKSVAEDRWVKK